MSRRNLDDIGPYTIVPKWVQQRCAADPRALQLYAWLGVYANNTTGIAWPKREKLAADLGVSVRSIARALEFLRQAGAVRTTLKHNANGAVGGLNFQLVRCEPEEDDLQATAGTKAGSPSGQICQAKRTTVSPPIKGRTRSIELEGARRARARVPLPRAGTKRPESWRYRAPGGAGNCPHDPQCSTFNACRDLILEEGRAARLSP
jgi:hypothetical protein